MSSSDPLLQPLRIRHLELKNRIMSTSHACGLEEGGMPLERYQAYHEEKARGGLALTMFGGSSNVSPDSPNTFQQLNVGTDEIIPHLLNFSRRVHGQGAALMCQITHLGRRGESYKDNWLPTIAPSAIRETLHRSFPREMDENDIARVVKDFGDAAWRCKEGGLDGIETLAGAHLIGQFLSPATNKRTDGFGGSVENRCRFGLMVYEEIRRRVGDDFIVGFRYVVDEGMKGGLSFNDCVEIAGIFERSGTLDFFNAVYGRMDTEIGLAVDNMPGMASPIAPWLQKAAAFRKEVGLPVFHAARIADISTARYAISEGLLDMVAMTRSHIADPHIVNKIMRGEEDRIRPCVGATHCMSEHRPRCVHNPASGHEGALPHVIRPSEGPRRRVAVVGGGPAGLEAARVSAERGHEVVLFEAANETGGQVRLAKEASWRGDIVGVVDWRAAEIERLGVDIRHNAYAQPDDVRAVSPDIVVVATGGVPDLDWLDGNEHATSVWDALTDPVPGVDDVIVYDGTGRHAAPSCAERFAKAGCNVSLVCIDGFAAAEMAYAERTLWKKHLYDAGIAVTPDHRLVAIEPDGNRLRGIFLNESNGATMERSADRIIVEHGTRAVTEVFDGLRSGSSNDGVTDLDALLAGRPQPETGTAEGDFALYRIGDAVASRNIAAAVLDALRLCRTF